MNSSHQETNLSNAFAGIYLQMNGQTRFWGWGTPPLSATRRAEEGSTQPAEGDQRIRFVCNRKFVGLLVR